MCVLCDNEALFIKGGVYYSNRHKAWETMTDEPNDAPTTEKLLIDNQSDFKFHAAYLTYLDAYDRAANEETKKQLNDHITALQQGQIDYSIFYQRMDEYRQGIAPEQRSGKALIETQRKKDWHRKMQKSERNKRYKR
jgi:hypothetical protein